MTSYSHKPDKITSIADLITFFEAIPEDRWCEDAFQLFNGQRCAVGHLGAAYLDRADRGWEVIDAAFGEEHPLHEMAYANNHRRGGNPKQGTLEFLRNQVTG